MRDSIDTRESDCAADLDDARLDRRMFVSRAALLGISVGLTEELVRAAEGVAVVQRTLRLDAPQQVGSLDPAFFATETDLAVMANIYEGLVTFKPGPGRWILVRTLAEEFEPSRDYRRFTFKLKRGVRFHRGFGELTAEDVKFSFERIAGLTKPRITSPYSQSFLGLERVRVTGKYTGTLVFKQPFAPLLRVTLPVVQGFIVSKKAVERLGERFGTNPIGTGPYELASYEPRAKVVLKRFAQYSGSSAGYAKPPQWERIEHINVPATTSVPIALESGALDFGRIPLPAIPRFQSDRRFVVGGRQTLGYYWIGMNVRHPNLRDINVRQAIRYGLDVPAILAAAFEGRYRRATASIAPAMGLGYWKDAPVYARDVDRARGFLARAGVARLNLTFTYSDASEGSRPVFEIAQASLAEVGITLTPRFQDGATFFANDREELERRQLTYITFGTQPDPSRNMQWWTCDQFGVWNWMFFCNREFDRRAGQALRTLDSARRHALYIEMQRVWNQNVNAVWIAWPNTFYAARSSIRPAVLPNGRPVAWAFRSV